MTPKQIWDIFLTNGDIVYEPDFLAEQAMIQADKEDLSYWQRGLYYGLAKMVDEQAYLLDDLEDEIYSGMDEETEVRWRVAHQDDGVDIGQRGELIE